MVHADRIVDHVHAAAAGETLDLGLEIDLGVEDGFVHAVRARHGGFLFGGNGAEHAGAEHFGHLGDEAAGAARGGVHQAGIAAFQRIGGVGEIMRRHALEHDRGGGRRNPGRRESSRVERRGPAAYSA